MHIHTLKGVKDLQVLLKVHKRMSDMRLGEVLMHENLINQMQLQHALENQKKHRAGGAARHLGRILVETGVVSPDQLNLALAKKLAIPCVKLEGYEVPDKLLGLVPADIALAHKVLPLAELNNGTSLAVAMLNPLDHVALEALRFNAKMNIEPVMVGANEIEAALTKYYSRYEETEALEDLDLEGDFLDPEQGGANDDVLENIEQEATKKPIVRLVNAIILQAVTNGASDINIRPERDKVNVYYRIDGKMQFVRTLNRTFLPALVSRIKITGQMDISERRLPQDGHARMVRHGHQVDLRISVIPTVNGESVVIRVLDKSAGFRPLSDLGLANSELHTVHRLISRPNGIFLVTGPTGSGKSTSLYAILDEVKKTNSHILTVEDPVEYDIEGVEQVQIALAKGYTFAKALRHFLRHDPDVIMVGEIRDEETAAIANKAALTGHLVFSTLHTNDAPSTVTRLLDMGIEPYLLSTTLLGVMAQRLVRVNCPACTVEEEVDPQIRPLLGLNDDEKFYHGEGCEECHYTGYRGRRTVIELLAVTPEIADMITNKGKTQEIADVAIKGGMTRLYESALKLARKGITSIEEVYALYTE